jgi:hypothetical protein
MLCRSFSAVSFLNVIISFSWLHSVFGLVQQTQQAATPCSPPLQISRRKWFVVSAAAPAPVLMAFCVVAARPQAALAVKERNEALCGTGFFTNIWEYRCTELGDIADEGIGKSFSASELGTADSLLSKLNLDSSSSSSSSTTNIQQKQESIPSDINDEEKTQMPLLGSVKEDWR